MMRESQKTCQPMFEQSFRVKSEDPSTLLIHSPEQKRGEVVLVCHNCFYYLATFFFFLIFMSFYFELTLNNIVFCCFIELSAIPPFSFLPLCGSPLFSRMLSTTFGKSALKLYFFEMYASDFPLAIYKERFFQP